MARKKELTIGFADFETTTALDIKAETGYDVRMDGVMAHMFDSEGNDMGIPTVRVKCAGMLVRFPDGSRNGCVVDSVEELMEKVVEWKVDRLYFHNLRFDDSFIGGVLQSEGIDLQDGWHVKSRSRLMSDMGAVYSDTLEFKGKKDPKSHRPKKHVCDVWDSAKIFASTLSKLGKDFGVTKIGGAGEEAERVGCDLRMKAYCLRDCRVLMTVMEYYFQQCRELTAGQRPYGWMTAASTAYNLCIMWANRKYGLRKMKWAFPPCTEEYGFPGWLREGYKGASPLLDPKIRGLVLHDVKVFDVNSMYPTQVKYAGLPAGRPKKLDMDIGGMMALHEEKGVLWIAKVKMRCDVKEGHRPTYMMKHRGADGEVLCAHVDDFSEDTYQVINNVDMELIERDYENIHVEVLEAVGFDAHFGFLGGFVDEWYAIKQDASRRKDSSMKAFAKLILNSLYGKFGANPEHRGAHYEYEDDIIKIREDENVEVDKHPLYLPLAMFITSYARDMISRTCNAMGWEHVAYTDTDSVHVHGLSNEECFERMDEAGYRLHPDDLGCFDYESRWRDAIYVRNKGYFHFGEMDRDTGEVILKNGKEIKEIKMAGVNRFEGMECVEDVLGKKLYGSQLGGCRVKGGTLLLPRKTEIDLSIDNITTRTRVKGMSRTKGMIEMKKREDDVFKMMGVS